MVLLTPRHPRPGHALSTDTIRVVCGDRPWFLDTTALTVTITSAFADCAAYNNRSLLYPRGTLWGGAADGAHSDLRAVGFETFDYEGPAVPEPCVLVLCAALALFLCRTRFARVAAIAMPLLLVVQIHAAPVEISSFQDNGSVTWSNTMQGLYQVEWSATPTGSWTASWTALDHIGSTSGTVMDATVPMFYRVQGYARATTTNIAELIALYSNAVAIASNALPDKISSRLIAITRYNTNLLWRIQSNGVAQVKMASFMRYTTATQYYQIGPHDLSFSSQWVTACPELRALCLRYAAFDRILLIKQILGMPPDSANDTVVEFWVSPDYLFRPAPDAEINDSVAGMAPSPDSPYLRAGMQVSSNWAAFYNSTYDSRNYGMSGGPTLGWPWTRLGYTYDWGMPADQCVGLSEFVIPSGMIASSYGTPVPIEVESITSAATYGN